MYFVLAGHTCLLSVTLARLAALGHCKSSVLGILILPHFARRGASSPAWVGSAAAVRLRRKGRRTRKKKRLLKLLKSRGKISSRCFFLVHFHRDQR